MVLDFNPIEWMVQPAGDSMGYQLARYSTFWGYDLIGGNASVVTLGKPRWLPLKAVVG